MGLAVHEGSEILSPFWGAGYDAVVLRGGGVDTGSRPPPLRTPLDEILGFGVTVDLETIQPKQPGSFHPWNLGDDAEQERSQVDHKVDVMVEAVLDRQEETARCTGDITSVSGPDLRSARRVHHGIVARIRSSVQCQHSWPAHDLRISD